MLGTTKTLCHDPANDQTVFNLASAEYDFNDKLSSWSCGKKVSYIFCKDTDPECNHDDRESGAGTMVNKEMKHQDWATTLVLENYSPFTLGAVTLFNWSDCKGQSAAFAVKELKTKRYWTRKNMETSSMYNDDISSLMVPFGMTVELYADDSW